MRRLKPILPIFLLAAFSGAVTADEPPNIVLIYADDLGYGDFSCYGAEHVQTPHCDRVAAEGMRFTDAHSPSAVCTPSRYGTLTGRYAWRTWLKNWVLFEHMPLLVETDRLTLPKMLQQHGYTTGCIGKWHLGWGSQINPDFSKDLAPGPLEVGFDYYFGVPFSHNSSLKLQNFVRNRRIVGLKEGESIDDEQVQKRLARRLEDTAINLSKEAVQFIETNRQRPFFLYYPTTNIHFPLTPNERFQGKSDAGTYGDFILEFDWAVGEILSTLDELNLAENTLLILTSDNGGRPTRGKMGSKGHKPCGELRGIKRQIWEGGHRVPLIVRWPGHVAPGTTCDETVCHTDIMPTCAALLKHQLPADAAEDGYSILPALLGEPYQKPLREATVHHSVNGMFAIRKGDWKLIEGDTSGDYRKGHNALAKAATLPELDPATGRFKPFAYDIVDFDQENPVYCLYNLADDPAETTNVAEKHPKKVEELRKLLNRYRDSGRSTPLPGSLPLVPRISGPYVHVYKPAADVFPGPDTTRLKAGQQYENWQPNDHAIIKGTDDRWHAIGITHPAVPGPPWHEGEFQGFHAVSPRGDLCGGLQQHTWHDLPKVLPPRDRPGEPPEFYAPYIIKKGDEFRMFYSPHSIRYATSPDLTSWTPRGELFQQAGGGRDPFVFRHDGKYVMLLTAGTGIVARTSNDLIVWSEPTSIYSMPDGEGGGAESPTMIRQGADFYLFYCRWDPKIDGAYQHITTVYRSNDPCDFHGREPIAALDAHAPEIFQDEHGDWYITSVEWPHRGLSIAPLVWEKEG